MITADFALSGRAICVYAGTAIEGAPGRTKSTFTLSRKWRAQFYVTVLRWNGHIDVCFGPSAE